MGISTYHTKKSPFIHAAEYINRCKVYAGFTLMKEDAEKNYRLAFDPLFKKFEQPSIAEQVANVLHKDEFEMNRTLNIARLYLQLAFSSSGFYQNPPSLEHVTIADTLFARAQTQYERYLQLYKKVNPNKWHKGEMCRFLLRCKQTIGGLNQYALNAWTLVEASPDVDSQLLAPKVIEDYQVIIQGKKQQPPEFINPDDPNYPRNIYVSLFGNQ